MQGGSSGIGYGLKYQARCISDVKADTDHTSFITGTLSLREENELIQLKSAQVHLIRLSSGGTELICEGLFSHPNEIWDLASCPFDQRIFYYILCISFCVLWWPSGRHDKLLSIDDENIFLWTLDCSKKAAQVQSKESSGMLHYLSGGAWDPHDMNAVATTCESSVQFWDLRTMKKTNAIERAHIRNANYDMKKSHILVTAEDESGIHIWDLRKPKSPAKELPGHTHCCLTPSRKKWVKFRTWAVTCNPEYDGLILSAGTDSTVNLWQAPTSAEDKATSESITEPLNQQADPLLNSYSDYEDSVYDDRNLTTILSGLAWSSREPWIFASLSYDGRVVVESVKPFLSRK
ncbi:hypothetical protein GOBAR_DD26884 [Gossypium barbadense]|nr:hypothetical protein GOBAR_DD26884 [Gossypium barbadense]